ncbi:hypothetical protein Clacol_005404 [Clathrus columnatus]|uniref:tripeptidyl-peptidase II n=1 Tax=Clathrus columnatus TaxID=1419009 RepID=A0AAV5AC58_9AGAM|nr:hypothetical protein Clacol_005404 [Clathrus columnatus]
MLIHCLSILISFLFRTQFNGGDKPMFVLKHSWPEPPVNWQLHSNPPPEHMLKLYIGLKQSHMDDMIEHLLEVSDPTSERYGDHLTKETLNQLVAPTPQSINAVDEWLKENDIDISAYQRSEAGDWLYVNVPLWKAEIMLQTKYHVFQHEETGESIIRTLSWSLPKYLEEHIDVVAPTSSFTRSRPMLQQLSQIQVPLQTTTSASQVSLDSLSNVCNATAITPDCLRTLYGSIDYVPSATDQNQIGITGFLEQYASYSDLTDFMKIYRPDVDDKDASFTIVQINGGGNNQSNPGIEANLDIQYAVGITYPTPNVFYSVGGRPPSIPDDTTPANSSEPYLDFLEYILQQDDIPLVISNSYGDTEQTVPKDYAIRICNEYAKLGALGKTVLFATGDYGVGMAPCTTNDGSNITHFQPDFPTSCPWITAIGGTADIGPERAAHLSGGGFSNYFPQPTWQKAAVKQFLDQLGDKYEGLYNTSGRAYPDGAAHAEYFEVVVDGKVLSIFGTSAACPTFAAIISLVNDYRLSQGKTSLGFLNPLLYKYPKLLTDITTGYNPGCGTGGFNATTGWDPVTGLGTPNFKEFQKLL